MFNGLKRAHEYSGIGQISNALTKLWNRDNPDWDAAAWLCYYNNLVIDAAKTGKVNSYEQYPAVNARIKKATGGSGKGARMPHFFQYSVNGRRTETAVDLKKQFSKPNASTMNRICAFFDDVGSISRTVDGVAPFNWQMLLSSDHLSCKMNTADVIEGINAVWELDSIDTANRIQVQEATDLQLKHDMAKADLLLEEAEHIVSEKFGSLEEAYPYFVRCLFTGENFHRPSHKKLFWQLFGEIAVRCIQENLENCTVCERCGAKVPAWVDNHFCLVGTKGFFECVDCGAVCERLNSRQCRCEECQHEHAAALKAKANKRYYRSMKEG